MPKGIYKRKPHTEITKEKMRQAHLGRGHPHTEATKEKMRQSALNKSPVTKATKEKMKQAHWGKKNKSWKGDDARFCAMHVWVRRRKGKASLYKCIDCGEQAIHWSNVDHSYKRKLEDYQPRCMKCHRKYDKEANLIIKKERK